MRQRPECEIQSNVRLCYAVPAGVGPRQLLARIAPLVGGPASPMIVSAMHKILGVEKVHVHIDFDGTAEHICLVEKNYRLEARIGVTE